MNNFKSDLKSDFTDAQQEMQVEFKNFLEAALADQNLEFDKSLQKQQSSLLKSLSSAVTLPLPPIMAGGAFSYQSTKGDPLKWLLVNELDDWNKTLDAFISENIDGGKLAPLDPKSLYIKDNGDFVPIIDVWE